MAQLRSIWLMGALAALVVIGLPATSQAQKGYNAGGATAPDGIFVGGGLSASSAFANKGPTGVGVRVEFGMPLKIVGPGQLDLVLPVVTTTDGGYYGGGRVNSITFYPEVQWDYVFPIHMKYRLSLAPFVGFGIGGVWAHAPGYHDGNFMIGFDMGAAVRFVFPFGLYVETQPLAFTFNIPLGNPFDFYAAYNWYAAVGYRWK